MFVFDNTNINGVPARATNTGTGYSDSNTSTQYYCTADMVITAGDIMANGQQMTEQISCSPNTGNVGNYYSWVTAVAGDNVSSGKARDSICPLGWTMPVGDGNAVDKSFAKLVETYASGATNDALLRTSATSFIRGGLYNYKDPRRVNGGAAGYYWSGTSSYSLTTFILYFSSRAPSNTNKYDKGDGIPVRCVAR